MVKLIKKAFKWYFSKSENTYSWIPSCTFPCIDKKK